MRIPESGAADTSLRGQHGAQGQGGDERPRPIPVRSPQSLRVSRRGDHDPDGAGATPAVPSGPLNLRAVAGRYRPRRLTGGTRADRHPVLARPTPFIADTVGGPANRSDRDCGSPPHDLPDPRSVGRPPPGLAPGCPAGPDSGSVSPRHRRAPPGRWHSQTSATVLHAGLPATPAGRGDRCGVPAGAPSSGPGCPSRTPSGSRWTRVGLAVSTAATRLRHGRGRQGQPALGMPRWAAGAAFSYRHARGFSHPLSRGPAHFAHLY